MDDDTCVDGDDGMKAGDCFNRAESSPLNDTTKSLVLVNYFRSVPVKPLACVQNSGNLIDMLQTCHAASANRWANFVAVDYYKVIQICFFSLAIEETKLSPSFHSVVWYE
mgnify:CR=1